MLAYLKMIDIEGECVDKNIIVIIWNAVNGKVGLRIEDKNEQKEENEKKKSGKHLKRE